MKHVGPFGRLSNDICIFFKREMLTSAFRALVKNPVKESFDITFMGNEKSCQNIDCFFFFFPIKTFFNWILNQYPK